MNNYSEAEIQNILKLYSKKKEYEKQRYDSVKDTEK